MKKCKNCKAKKIQLITIINNKLRSLNQGKALSIRSSWTSITVWKWRILRNGLMRCKICIKLMS